MYINLISIKYENKIEKIQKFIEFYNYATRNICLGNEYRILIKSKNQSR